VNQVLDFWAPATRANPYPMYAEMRRNGSLCRIEPDGVWAVSRYEDVQFVLKNTQIFSSEGFRRALRPDWLHRNPLADSMLVMDPPTHTSLRATMSRAFSPRVISELEPHIRATCERLAGSLDGRDEADFVADFAMPLAASVIGDLLGLDPDLHHEFSRWNDDIAAIGPAPESPERAAQIAATLETMEGYLRQVVAARRRAPRSDLITALLGVDLNGRPLSDDEIVSFLFLLLPAGLHTPVYLLTNAVLALARFPETLARVRADAALVPAFLEEVLRYDPPSHGILRLTTADVELAGTTVPAGSLVLILLASANRDERQFPEPDRFDLDRGAQGVVAFGHGVHHCLGAALARLEVRIALESLISRFRAVERPSGEVAWIRSITLRGPVTLPLRFIPA